MIAQITVNYTAAALCASHVLVGDACIDSLFMPLLDKSCLNGFTCGNIAATTRDVATFYSALGELGIVQDVELVAQLLEV